jgi:hypothetical protein
MHGQAGASYSITVSNAAGALATSGTITVTDPPTNFTVTAIAGTGWTCTLATLTCTRSDALAAGQSYPAITVTGNVTGNAGQSISVPITISGGGMTTNVTSSPSIAIVAPPSITSANSAMFTVGTAGTFTVTATGSPAPTFSEMGALPSGVTLNSTTGVLSGTPAAGSGGTYPITITAQNSVTPNATQPFTLTVDQAPSITSGNSASFLVGAAGTFTVTATGFPAPTLSESGALPTGVTFNAATGVLSGTPAGGTQNSYNISFTAQNGVGTNATQNFTLTVGLAPTITSGNSTTFTVGTAGTFTVTATGFPAPTFSETGTLPSGVSLSAAGVLSGTPAAGTGKAYSITITASNGVTPNASQTFTLTVDQAPAITSGTSATFTVGTAGTFTVMATGFPAPTFSETGTLPSGVSLSSAGVLSGTPASGTQGSYPIVITAQNGVGTNATQSFTLNVDLAPAITSVNNTTFTVGTPGTFTATATGFPAPTFSETGSLPSGVTLSAAGVLSGTPAAGSGKTYQITITASNGATPNASQTFTLTVDQAPAITSGTSTTFTVGTAGTFTVMASGFPVATFSETGALPTGVTLSTTGVLSGTPASGTQGPYSIVITAANGVSPNATQSFTLTVDSAPAITSGSSTTFTVGTPGTFTVTATGLPAPTFSESGALPSGVTLNSATGALSGTPGANSGGSYPITITAQNGITPNATQSFTLTVDQAPAITSANSTTFAVSSASSFTVTASGFPAPTFGETGTLPTGVSFNTTTGVLSGTPASGTQTSSPYSITFTAQNGVGTNATQSFTLTVSFTAAPSITSANNATFTVGSAGTFTVTASGAPASTFSETGALPSGVTLNTTTGVLGGTPGALSGGTYPITITAQNGITPNATQSFTLTVDQAPAITTGNSTTFSVGANGTFTVKATGFPAPTFSETGALPAGVTLNATTGILSGTPGPGTQGPYPITITAQNGITPNATQSFTLTVNSAPVITSANTATFTVGMAGSFTVTATGSPAPTFSETGALPSGVSLNATTGALSGTPGAGTGGTYPITITAQNGITPNGTQSFTLTVDSAPVFTSANSTSFTVGVAGSFMVTTKGLPFPTLAETVTLPSGVSFADNGNGTGTLSWTASVASGSYALTFTATNGISPNAIQSFALTVDSAPVITSANNTSFTAGTAGSFTVQTTGFPTPALTETATLPSGVSFHDNADGTGTLSWTAAVASGSYGLSFTASNGVSPNATQPFTLAADSAPAITSANGVVFTVGVAGSFNVTTSGFPAPSLSETATLPSGVSFSDNGNGTGTLSWTTAVASGTYSLSFTASNGILPDATQSFTLTATAYYSVTGTVSYSGTHTGSFRTYIRVYPSGNTCVGNCGGAVAGTSLPSEPSSTGTSYTVRGLQPGSYVVVAEIDTLNNGAPNASNPYASSANFTINASNVSLPNIQLLDPTVPAPVAPSGVSAAPGITFALVQYNQGNSNGLADNNGREIATSYRVYYDTNNTFSHNTFYTFAAHGLSDRGFIVSGLTTGTPYYFQVSALNANGEAKSGPSGPFTPAAGTGPYTVSGTVTFPGTATGPMYVGLYDGTNNIIYGKKISTPFSSGVSYSVTGVPAGNYQAFAIIDQNNNGLIEPSDISNVNNNQGGPPPLSVNANTTNNIALTSAISTMSVTTNHFQFLANPDDYNLTLNIQWGTKRPVAMTLTSGANVAVPWDLPVDPNNYESSPNLPNGIIPVVGSAYQFQVTFSDNTTQTLPASITADLAFANPTMITSGSGTPTPTPTQPWLSWTAPSPLPTITPYVYAVGISDSTNPSGGINWNYSGQNGNGIPSTQTSVPFNTDGSASGCPSSPCSLAEGVAYNWFVYVQDANGNDSQLITSYTAPVGPAAKIVFSQQPGAATAGSIMSTIQVSIEDATGAVVTTANNPITIAISNNPSGGTLSGTLTVSPVNGVATFSDLSINNPGSNYTLVASAGGTSFTATSTAFSVAGTPTQIGFVQQPGNTTPGSMFQAQVAIEDVAGNIVTTAFGNVGIAIGNNPGGGTLSGVTTASTVNGVATFANLSINNGGNGYTLVASLSGFSNVTSSSFNVVTSGPATCASAPTGKESVLSGRWVMMMQGWSGTNPGSPVAMAGTFDASGTGTFVDVSGGSGFTGAVDVNNGANGASSAVSGNFLTTGSSYKVGLDPVNSTGYLGCMTIADSGGGATTLRFALSVTAGTATHGRIIRWMDTSGNGSGNRAIGVMMPQDATAFPSGGTTHLHTNYAFGESGHDSGGKQFSIAGTFALTPATGAATANYDLDDGGSVSASQTESLTVTGVTAAYGRGVATGTPQGSTTATHTAVYIVNANELFLIGIDPFSPSGVIYAGRAIVTGTSFTNASLTGNYVIQLSGSSSGNSNCNGGSNCATINMGILSLSGTGTINATSQLYDYTSGSAPQTNNPSGTYSVVASGRTTVVAGGHPPVLYLATPQSNTEPFVAFVVGTDTSAASGWFEKGASSNLSVGSFAGTHIFGDFNPGDSSVGLQTGVASFDASGNVTGYQYRSDTSTGLSEQNINSGGGGSATFAITNSPLPGFGTIAGSLAVTDGTRIWFFDSGGSNTSPANIIEVEP